MKVLLNRPPGELIILKQLQREEGNSKDSSEKKLYTFPLPNHYGWIQQKKKRKEKKKMKYQPTILCRLPSFSKVSLCQEESEGLVTVGAALLTEQTFHASDLENIWL